MPNDREIHKLSRKAQRIIDLADDENRDLHPEESREVSAILNEIEARRKTDNGAAEFAKSLGSNGPVTAGGATRGGPGAAFVKSEGFRRISDPANRGQSWSTGMVDVGSFGAKAGTALESGQGAGLLPVPQVVPGVVERLFEPLAVADVFAQRQHDCGNSVRYINEGTATSGAAGVAEGAAKPASDLAYSTVDEPVKKIATSITVSDELLDDAASVEAFIGSRLALFVKLEEERQLLRGAGTNELVGVFGRSINAYTKAAGDDNAVALAKVIANTRGSSQLEPSAIIMHPTNWLATRLLRDGTGGTVGQFYGGGPITGAYGNAGAPGLFGQLLWNVPVVLSTVVGAGTALVGAFNTGAEIHRRGGVSVEATNSHSDYFVKNLIALRSEQREALAVYRANAFTAVSGLTS